MRSVVVGLGSNLGARTAYLAAAAAVLDAHPAIRVEARSPLVATPALTQPQPDFLNAAVRLRTPLEPEALLDVLLVTERALGRERRERWGTRTIDLDVLSIRNETVRTERLEVPHPALMTRSFALFPLLAVLEAGDPFRRVCEAAAACLAPPPRWPWPMSAPPSCNEFDTFSPSPEDSAPGVSGPGAGASERAERLAAAAQAALDRAGGVCALGGPIERLSHLDAPAAELVEVLGRVRPARVLVAPDGAVLGLGTRAAPTALFVLSASALYASTPAAHPLRARPTGAPG